MMAQRWVPQVIAVVLLLLALSSVSALIADLFAHRFRLAEIAWLEGKALSVQEWESGRETLETALLFSPGHPDYLLALGRWHASAQYLPDIEDPLTPMIEAVSYYGRGLEIRPYWPYAWSELTFLQAQLQGFDDSFSFSFTKALAYGPWEGAVRVNAIRSAFEIWEELPEPHREYVFGVLGETLTFHKPFAEAAMEVVDAYGLMPDACERLLVEMQEFKLDKPCTG